MMMGDSFPTVQMADDYGMKLARDWIDESPRGRETI
jgi:hypothetical protein